MKTRLSQTDQNTLMRAWLVQLHHEHETICRQFGVDLSTPAFEISSSSTCWGSWHPATATVKISFHLIEKHSWDVVVNVLKHEMAHQLVSTLYGSDEKHGPFFIKACDMLGVPGGFRSASGDLPRSIPKTHEKAAKTQESKLILKVEKLLSLAQSQNEHEAQRAMEKANNLIAGYNLQRAQSGEKSDLNIIIINHKKKRIENYQRKICTILSRHFFVKIILANLYDAGSCCSHKTIELFGARENILIAEYVYYFLLSTMDFLWDDYKGRHTTTGRKKRSFQLGLLEGFDKKLAERKNKEKAGNNHPSGNKETTKALITVMDRELDTFIAQRYPRISRRQHRSGKIHGREFQAGIQEGHNLTLKKGVCTKDGFRGGMLSHTKPDSQLH